MKKEIIRNPGSEHPYPAAVKAGNLIFVTVAAEEDSAAIKSGPSFEEQFTACFERIKQTLESQGSSMGDIMQLNVYFVDLERDAEKAGPIWQKYLPEDKWPVGAWIGIKQLLPSDPTLLVEVGCIAIIPDE